MAIINGDDTANVFQVGPTQDEIYGFGGDDVFFLYDNSGVHDRLYGGVGIDTIQVWLSFSSALFIDLHDAGGIISYGTEGFSVSGFVYSIENAISGAFDDHLSGNDYSNVLNGANGDDLLKGRNGADQLIGGGSEGSRIGWV